MTRIAKPKSMIPEDELRCHPNWVAGVQCTSLPSRAGLGSCPGNAAAGRIIILPGWTPGARWLRANSHSGSAGLKWSPLRISLSSYRRANGKLFVTGFCWLGGQSFCFATNRADLAAAFVFYGLPRSDLCETSSRSAKIPVGTVPCKGPV
jgi:hypothetical protein